MPATTAPLVCWPLVPGATSYNLLRSTSRDGQYAPVATGFVAPVVRERAERRAVYVDATAVNGSEYFYKVQSVNPTGSSEMSPPSAATKPSPEQSGDAPPAPANLKVTGSGHHRVALAWTASPGASFYRVWRTTLHADGVGGNYPVGRVLLDDATEAVTFTDTSPTDGRDYSYAIEAVNPAGVSAASASVTARPLPDPPSAAPAVSRRALEQDPRRAGDHADLVAGRWSDRIRHLPLVRPRAGVHLAGPLPDGPRGNHLRR